MDIGVAAIGSQFFIRKALAYHEVYSNVEITPFVYQKPEESAEIVRSLADFDVLFFGGPVPYYLAKQEIESKEKLLCKQIPAVYPQFDDHTLAMCLYYLRNNLHVTTNRLSIDFPSSHHVYRVLRELDIESSDIHVKELHAELVSDGAFRTDDLVDYHYSLIKSGKADYIITIVSSVYLELKKRGVDVFKMFITEKNIEDAFNKALLGGELTITRKTQIAVGILDLDFDVALDEDQCAVLEGLLHEFGAKTNASIKSLSHHKHLIFMTKGALDYITDNWQEMYLIEKIRSKVGITANVGFGLGFTSKQAEKYAANALNKAKTLDGGKCFIMDSQKVIYGPLSGQINKIHLKSEEKLIVNLSESTGLGVTNISKYYEFLKFKAYGSFTAPELADFFQVSQRSAERFLKNLVISDSLKFVGKEQPSSGGRPRSIYKANIQPKESSKV